MKKRSPILIIVFAVIIGGLVMILLNGAVRPAAAVVAKQGLTAGVILTADMLEVRSVPSAGLPEGTYTKIEDAVGQTLTVGRAAGDYITMYVVGESAASGIPSQLAPDHLAIAVKVDMATGVAGLVREGQTVTIIGMIAPDVLGHSLQTSAFEAPALTAPDGGALVVTPTPTPTPAPAQSPIARIAISGLKVLMVPQSFRYQEVAPTEGEDQMWASAMTASATKEGSVVVLEVPTKAVEIVPGTWVNPATLVAMLSNYGHVQLALESAQGFQGEGIVTLNIGQLYDDLNAETVK